MGSNVHVELRPLEMKKKPNKAGPLLLCFPLLLLVVSVSCSAPSANFAEQFEKIKRDPHVLYAFLKKMPKGGELHSHLSGAVPFERLLAVAIRHNYKVAFRKDDGYVCGFTGPGRDREWNEPCRTANIVAKQVAGLSSEECNRLREAVTLDLSDRERGEDSGFAKFSRIFDRLSALTDNADVMPEFVQEVMEEAASNNVSYLELRANPIGRQDLEDKAVPIEELVLRLKDSVAQKNRHLGPQHAVVVKFIVGLQRQTPNNPGGITELRPVSCSLQSRCPSRLRQAYFLAARRYSDIVVGVDLVGLPEVDSSADFSALRREFDEASITLHAGETLDPTGQNHIQEAILAGAKRIGHGFNLQNSAAATALVCTRQIPLEISLTSNKLLGLLPGDDLKAHPFPKYFRAEICGERRRQEAGHLPVTLNTDDAGIFQTDLTNEFFLAETTFDLSWDEVKQLARNSLLNSFATESERLCLLQRWEREIARLENVPERVGFLKAAWQFLITVPSSFANFFFQLFKASATLGFLVVLVLYALGYWLWLISFRKRYITIAPFRVWGTKLGGLSGDGVAARLRDELMQLLRDMQPAPSGQQPDAGLEPSYFATNVQQANAGPEPSYFTTKKAGVVRMPEEEVTVQYQGISPDALNAFLRRVFGRQVLITGDVISHGRGLLIIARSARCGPWKARAKAKNAVALQAALEELAANVIIDFPEISGGDATP